MFSYCRKYDFRDVWCQYSLWYLPLSFVFQHEPPTPFVEVVGQVGYDCSITVDKIVNYGSDFGAWLSFQQLTCISLLFCSHWPLPSIDAACPCTCYLTLYMLPVLVHATCTCYLYMLPDPVHATCPCTCYLSLYMLPVPVHATRPCTCYLTLYMLPVPVHATCPCTCYLSLYMLPVPVHATWPCTCYLTPTSCICFLSSLTELPRVCLVRTNTTSRTCHVCNVVECHKIWCMTHQCAFPGTGISGSFIFPDMSNLS